MVLSQSELQSYLNKNQPAPGMTLEQTILALGAAEEAARPKEVYGGSLGYAKTGGGGSSRVIDVVRMVHVTPQGDSVYEKKVYSSGPMMLQNAGATQPDLRTTEQKMATGEMRGIGQPSQTQVLSQQQLQTSVYKAQGQYLEKATGLPYALFISPATGQPTATFEQYSAQLGKYSYTNMLAQATEDAATKGKGFVPGVGTLVGGGATATETTLAPTSTSFLFTVGNAPPYSPSPIAQKQTIFEVQVKTPFGMYGGIPDVFGKPKEATIRQTGIAVAETTTQQFGLASTVLGIPQKPEVKSTLIFQDLSATLYPTSKVQAWQNYSKDTKEKQEKEISEIKQSFKDKGYIVSTYEWTEPTTGVTTTRFGIPVRDFSLLPATPIERTERAIAPYISTMSATNTGDILKSLLPSAQIANIVLPKENKIEYKMTGLKVAADVLALDTVKMATREGAKLTLGSYYRLAPIQAATIEQAKAWHEDSGMRERYKELYQSQLSGWQTESAINIGTTGAFIVAGEAIQAIRLTGGAVPFVEAIIPNARVPFMELPEAGTKAGDLARLANIEKLGGTISLRYTPSETGEVQGAIRKEIVSGYSPTSSIIAGKNRMVVAKFEDITSTGYITGKGTYSINLEFNTNYPFESGFGVIPQRGSVKLFGGEGETLVGYTGKIVPYEIVPKQAFTQPGAEKPSITSVVEFEKRGELRLYGMEGNVEWGAVPKQYASIVTETTEQVALGKPYPFGEKIITNQGAISMKGGRLPMYSSQKIETYSSEGTAFTQYSYEGGEWKKGIFKLGTATEETQSIPLAKFSQQMSLRPTKMGTFETPKIMGERGVSLYGETLSERLTKSADVRLFLSKERLDVFNLAGGGTPMAYQTAYVYGIKQGTTTGSKTVMRTIMQTIEQEQPAIFATPSQRPITIGTQIPVQVATQIPITIPTQVATQFPTQIPTQLPVQMPTQIPTQIPTQMPVQMPVQIPMQIPKQIPKQMPFQVPTQIPTQLPVQMPTQIPTQIPTQMPVQMPVQIPMQIPSQTPFQIPTQTPIQKPLEIIPPPPPGGGINFPGIRETPLFGGKYKRPKGKYQPSFTAIQFNIRGKISKGLAETGLAIRPITKKGKKK